MQLSPHFTLAELTRSPTAQRRGISNRPTPEHIENMKNVCEKILEPVRAHFGKPVRINSSYRSPALNKAIGGASRSQHCNGEAVDFEIMGVSNKAVADWVGDNLEFDQCILEFWAPGGDPNAGWVHASLKRHGTNRGQKLIARKTGGRTTYTPVDDFDPSTAPAKVKKLVQATVPTDKCDHCGQPLPSSAAKPAAPARTPAPRRAPAAAKVTETNIQALQTRDPNSFALGRYALVGKMLDTRFDGDQQQHLSNLVSVLWRWTESLALPKLSHYGMTAYHVDQIVAASL